MGGSKPDKPISTRVPNGLVEDFDRYVEKHDFSSKSEALRQLIKDAVVEDYEEEVTFRELFQHKPIYTLLAIPLLLLGGLGIAAAGIIGLYHGAMVGWGATELNLGLLIVALALYGASAFLLFVPGFVLQKKARTTAARHRMRLARTDHLEAEKTNKNTGVES